MQRTATIPLHEMALEPLDFQRFYEEHADFVRSVVARLLGPGGDADDLMQEVFLVAFRKLPDTPVESPRGWLCQIAVKLATNARRRSWVRRVLGFGSGIEEPVETRTPEQVAEVREATRNVYAVLERMSEKKRTAFVLFEIQGLSGQEIADALGIPMQTVHTRLFHARREFMAAYEKLQSAPVGRGGCHGG